MPITQDSLHTLLATAFPGGSVTITDLAGDNDHYRVEVADASFSGKSRIEQHRMVSEVLKDENIHALSIKTIALQP